uniref:N-acetyltransferase domain-containing protein n=1 Tax=Panagrolaimus sp. JU765 TaxID=591449 RepID=A0AC34QYB0_9BILA
MAPLAFSWVDQMIDKEVTFLAFADDRLVGVSLNTFINRQEFPTIFRNGFSVPNPELEMLPDYAEFIANGPFDNHKANQFDALVDIGLAHVGRYIPSHIQRIGYGDACAVDPRFHKSGVGLELLKQFYVRGPRDFGCEAFFAFCVASGTRQICLKHLGMTEAFLIPYDKFLENGQPIYSNLYDKAEGNSVVYKEVK